MHLTATSMFRTIRAGALAAALAACSTAGPPTLTGSAADPCHGRDVAAQAAATQGLPPYVGKDRYANAAMPAGTVFYSLTPGAPPGFAVTEATLRAAAGDWRKYYTLVQVTTDPGVDAEGRPRQLRETVRAFHATEALCVAHGIARANPQFGDGGGQQYYVSPLDAHKLRPGAITPIGQWRAADTSANDDRRRASLARP